MHIELDQNYINTKPWMKFPEYILILREYNIRMY